MYSNKEIATMSPENAAAAKRINAMKKQSSAFAAKCRSSKCFGCGGTLSPFSTSEIEISGTRRLVCESCDR